MSLQLLLAEYRQSHQNPTNQLIHFICVPAIVFATLAMAWTANLSLLGVAEPLGRWVNLASVGGLAALAYYAWLGARAFAGMVLFSAPIVLAILAIEAAGLPLFGIAVAVFIASWAVQFYGHEVEGAKPSFLKDLHFLLIGPLFVLDEWGFSLSQDGHTPAEA